jgi:predicted DNA-binding transcriptional regulator AlpA
VLKLLRVGAETGENVSQLAEEFFLKVLHGNLKIQHDAVSNRRLQMHHSKATETNSAFLEFDNLPNSAFIRLPVMVNLYGVSPATIWRGVKSGAIPKPAKLTERTTAWNVGVVRDALALKAA